MRRLLTTESNKHNDTKYNKKYIIIGDEKTWKVYIKK